MSTLASPVQTNQITGTASADLQSANQSGSSEVSVGQLMLQAGWVFLHKFSHNKYCDTLKLSQDTRDT